MNKSCLLACIACFVLGATVLAAPENEVEKDKVYTAKVTISQDFIRNYGKVINNFDFNYKHGQLVQTLRDEVIKQSKKSRFYIRCGDIFLNDNEPLTLVDCSQATVCMEW